VSAKRVTTRMPSKGVVWTREDCQGLVGQKFLTTYGDGYVAEAEIVEAKVGYDGALEMTVEVPDTPARCALTATRSARTEEQGEPAVFPGFSSVPARPHVVLAVGKAGDPDHGPGVWRFDEHATPDVHAHMPRPA
jgi:hypothetical protein